MLRGCYRTGKGGGSKSPMSDDLLGAGVSSNSLVANLLAKGVGPANARDQGRVWFMSRDDILEELLSLSLMLVAMSIPTAWIPARRTPSA